MKKRHCFLATSFVLSSETTALSSFRKRQPATGRETLKISLPAPDREFSPKWFYKDENWKRKRIFTTLMWFNIPSRHHQKPSLIPPVVCFLQFGKYSSNLKIIVSSFCGLFHLFPVLTKLILNPNGSPERGKKKTMNEGRASSISVFLGSKHIKSGQFGRVRSSFSKKTPVFVWNHHLKGPLHWTSMRLNLLTIATILH